MLQSPFTETTQRAHMPACMKRWSIKRRLMIYSKLIYFALKENRLACRPDLCAAYSIGVTPSSDCTPRVLYSVEQALRSSLPHALVCCLQHTDALLRGMFVNCLRPGLACPACGRPRSDSRVVALRSDPGGKANRKPAPDSKRARLRTAKRGCECYLSSSSLLRGSTQRAAREMAHACSQARRLRPIPADR